MPIRVPYCLYVVLLVTATGVTPCSAEPSTTGKQLELPCKDVPSEWLTHAEQTDFRETPRYAETVDYCRRLAKASDWLDYQPFGTSPEGRELPLVIASKERAFTPTAAQATGKLIVLSQCCIHAGECAGKDANLMLLRDIAVTKTRAELLDNVILLVIPIFSTDGHERFSPYNRINQNGPDQMGWRVTARNLNLNRDYMKADAVEMRAWLALWNAWQPDFHFDHHSTDGGDWQYDLLFTTDRHQAVAPQVVSWLNETLYPQLIPALEADGHLPMTYFTLVDSKDPAMGIRSGGFGPRYSTGYVSLRNRPSILVETHALKPYRTRVIGHYNITRRTLEVLNCGPQTLRQAVQAADAQTTKLGETYDPQRKLPLTLKRTGEWEPITFRGFAYRREPSKISGDLRIIYDNTQPRELETRWFNRTEVDQTIDSPRAYLIPPQWTEVIELLEAHGLRYRRLTQPLATEVQTYRFRNVSFPHMPYEGRFAPRFETERFTESRTYLPGSLLVPLDQPAAKVAIHLLEPDAPDSAVRWGLFNAIFERKEYGEHYVLEALARRMLTQDAQLKAEFQALLDSDPQFAGNPWARLYFFYQRSPYFDAAQNVYPVGRLLGELPGKEGMGGME